MSEFEPKPGMTSRLKAIFPGLAGVKAAAADPAGTRPASSATVAPSAWRAPLSRAQSPLNIEDATLPPLIGSWVEDGRQGADKEGV